MNPTEELTVEVFRAGDYGPKGRYTESDLDAIAADYQQDRHEAPVTLDHQQSGPAHGWVKSLCRAGDRLIATIGRLSPALAKLLERQAYKKRSVELYRRFDATGRPYLKAVSFLGAATPEVKGLVDPLFSECVLFEEDHAPSSGSSAEEAKRLLRTRALWRPSWEQAGLGAVFQALDGTPELTTLVTILSETNPAIPLGRVAVDAFGEQNGAVPVGASPESVERHRRALALQSVDPALSYRDALLRVSP